MELVLKLDDSKIEKIIRNLADGSEKRIPDTESGDGVTSYWKHHRSIIDIERIGAGKVRVSGESGFNFPGMTYSELDYLNTLHKRYGHMRDISGTKFDLSIPQSSDNKNFGYKVSGKWINSDFLRAIDHVRRIITQSEQAGITLPDSPRILEIGSGTGILALVFKLLFKKSTYFLVDFPETLTLASVFLNIVLPNSKILYFTEWSKNPDLLRSNDYDFILVPNHAMSRIPKGSIHLAVNTDSMQEMNYQTIGVYFNELRRVLVNPALFYQNNRDKVMDGVLIEVSKYPYNANDQHILYKGRNQFQSKSFIMKSLFKNIPLLRRIKVPVLKTGMQYAFLTKLSNTEPSREQS